MEKLPAGPGDLAGWQTRPSSRLPPQRRAPPQFEVGGEIAFRAQTSPTRTSAQVPGRRRRLQGSRLPAPDWAGDISEPSWGTATPS